MTKLDLKNNISYISGNFTVIALCVFAFCVSLGAALVSLSKLLVVIAFVNKIFFKDKAHFFINLKQHKKIFIWMFFACAWMAFSGLWSPATFEEKFYYLTHHSKFLWIFIIYYLIATKEQAISILQFLIYGQCFVIAISFSMWFGMEIPLTKEPINNGVAFTSTLEQPIMTSLVLIILWCLKELWYKIYAKFVIDLVMVIMSINIIFIMVGRTAYIIYLSLTYIVFLQSIAKKWWWTSLIFISILFISLYNLSPKFEKGVNQIKNNTEIYIYDKKPYTSESARLDTWRLTLSGIKKNIVFGNGLGSISYVYKSEGGILLDKVSQPHQQYLFWWSEFGLIGLVIMMYFFIILFNDSNRGQSNNKNLMRLTLIALFVTGLFNCPFFGIGLAEFFFIIIGTSLFLLQADSNLKRNALD
jgi:O-antigen ligase